MGRALRKLQSHLLVRQCPGTGLQNTVHNPKSSMRSHPDNFPKWGGGFAAATNAQGYGSAQAFAARLRASPAPCKRALEPCLLQEEDGSSRGGHKALRSWSASVGQSVAHTHLVPGRELFPAGGTTPILGRPAPTAVVTLQTFPWRMWTLGPAGAGGGGRAGSAAVSVVGLSLQDLFGAVACAETTVGGRLLRFLLVDGGEGFAAIAVCVAPESPLVVAVHKSVASAVGPDGPAFAQDLAVPLTLQQAHALKDNSSAAVEARTAAVIIGPGQGG